MTLAEKIFNCFKDNESFSLKEAYQQNADKPKETVRARIYEKIGIRFERILLWQLNSTIYAMNLWLFLI